MHISRKALAAIPGIAIVFIFLLSPLAAQIQRPDPMGPPGGLGSGNPTNPGNLGGDIPGSLNTARHGPILLSGRVVLDNGSPPPEPVQIERMCTDRSGGRPHPEGYTDSKGRFSVTLGDDRSIMPDASEERNGSAQPDLSTCQLRALLPGFRSDTISLATHRYLDNPDVGTIILHRAENVEGLTISATSALAPKDARKAYEKGMEDVRKKKTDEAQKEFEKAVASYPKYASAWFQLGLTYEQGNQTDEARKAYTQSIAADSKYINPYERLYLMGAKEQKWQEVADASGHVIQLNPFDFRDAYYFNAIANLQLGHLDPAEKSGREAVKLDIAHQNPRTIYVLGVILAKKGEFAPAADLLRAYLQVDPNAADANAVRKQLAELEKSAGGHPQ